MSDASHWSIFLNAALINNFVLEVETSAARLSEAISVKMTLHS